MIFVQFIARLPVLTAWLLLSVNVNKSNAWTLSPIISNRNNKCYDSPNVDGRIRGKALSLLSSLRVEEKGDSTIRCDDVAVLLNRNAGSVHEDMIPIAEECFGADNVFVTRNVEEAKEAASALLQNRHKHRLWIPIGGDGTLSCLLQFLVDGLEDTDEQDAIIASLPPLAYLPMGTGNALGSVVGNQLLPNLSSRLLLFGRHRRRMKAFREMLQRFANGDNYNNTNEYGIATDGSYNQATTIQVPLMQVSALTQNNTHLPPQLCFFAGAGFDSLLLDDYRNMMKEGRKLSNRQRRFSKNAIVGYTTALLTKTLPKTSLYYDQHLLNMKLYTTNNVNSHDATYWIDHRRGDWCIPLSVQKNTNSNLQDNTTDVITQPQQQEKILLLEGKVGIVAAGTCPFYGGGLRLFPFAGTTVGKDRPLMHLRVGRIHPLEGFWNVFDIFSGSYRDTSPQSFGCLDLIGSNFTIQLLDESSYPLQHSGESVGNVRSFQMQTLKSKISFLSLLPSPPFVTGNN